MNNIFVFLGESASLDIGVLFGGPQAQLYQIQQDILAKLIHRYEISRTGTHFGFVKYGEGASLGIPLSKYESKLQLLSKITYLNPGNNPGNNLYMGLEVAQKELFAVENGARVDALKKLIIFVTGSFEYPSDISKQLKNMGVEIVVVSVGTSGNDDQLKKLVSDDSNIIIADPDDIERIAIVIEEKFTPGEHLLFCYFVLNGQENAWSMSDGDLMS